LRMPLREPQRPWTHIPRTLLFAREIERLAMVSNPP